MDDISRQIKKAIEGVKSEVSRIAHKETAKAAAPLLAALDREVAGVFEARAGKSVEDLTEEVTAAATRAGVDLEPGELQAIVATIESGERPEFVADIRITGLD